MKIFNNKREIADFFMRKDYDFLPGKSRKKIRPASSRRGGFKQAEQVSLRRRLDAIPLSSC
jgi:hypothetical protein